MENPVMCQPRKIKCKSHTTKILAGSAASKVGLSLLTKITRDKRKGERVLGKKLKPLCLDQKAKTAAERKWNLIRKVGEENSSKRDFSPRP